MEHHSNINSYLMHTKFPLPPFFQDSFFVWPPRSYSCTFCTREFRSAQALGGHMNVHRRDRARLKQSLPPAAAADNSSSPHEIKGIIRRSDGDIEDDIVCNKRHKLMCSIDEIDLELRL